MTPASRRARAFTLMEALVVAAVVIVLAAITGPVVTTLKLRAARTAALGKMQSVTALLKNYAALHDGELPAEDAAGTDDWRAATAVANATAWYNVLPKLGGHGGVQDFAANPVSFYAAENVLWLPGATYPEDGKRLKRPYFAFAINTKLQRKSDDGTKQKVKLEEITSPAKTVAFLEEGLPGESKVSPAQSKYTGSCKGSAKSFVARYLGRGILTFIDGHAEPVDGKEILTAEGLFPFPQTDIVWTRTPEENPNK